MKTAWKEKQDGTNTNGNQFAVETDYKNKMVQELHLGGTTMVTDAQMFANTNFHVQFWNEKQVSTLY